MTGAWLATMLLALDDGILGVLSLDGVHRMVLVATYWRTRRRDAGNRGGVVATAAGDDDELPVVTMQLPLYNEL
ncbi:MAG TPA: hypothetical protein VM617_06990 [Thermoanaerobaculia bacterium]|nr:hypothetical protein [Thermoanaerobaculia bacterium]